MEVAGFEAGMDTGRRRRLTLALAHRHPQADARIAGLRRAVHAAVIARKMADEHE